LKNIQEILPKTQEAQQLSEKALDKAEQEVLVFIYWSI